MVGYQYKELNAFENQIIQLWFLEWWTLKGCWSFSITNINHENTIRLTHPLPTVCPDDGTHSEMLLIVSCP